MALGNGAQPPSLLLTAVISAMFGPFGAIPASIHAGQARALGADANRYWVTFMVAWATSVVALTLLTALSLLLFFVTFATLQ